MHKTIKQIKENLNRVVQEYVVTKPFPADNDITFQDIDLIDPNLDVPQRIKRAIPFLSKNKNRSNFYFNTQGARGCCGEPRRTYRLHRVGLQDHL